MCCGYPISEKAVREIKEISVERTYHIEFDVTFKSNSKFDWDVLDDLDGKRADFPRFIYRMVENTFDGWVEGKVSMLPKVERREYYT